jgi:hypothetical protein
MALLQTRIYFYGHCLYNCSLLLLILLDSDRGDNTVTENIFIYISPLAVALLYS